MAEQKFMFKTWAVLWICVKNVSLFHWLTFLITFIKICEALPGYPSNTKQTEIENSNLFGGDN